MVVFSPLEASSLRSAISAYVFILFVYATGLWGFYGLVQVNNTTPYTYFLNPGSPGVLFNLRWTVDYPLFFVYMAQGFYCWVLFFNMRAIADYRSSLSSSVALFITILAIGLNAVMLVFLGIAWTSANVDGQAFNPANDPRYCCVYYANPANACPNTVACVPPVAPSDLRVNTDFLIMFWFTVCIAVWHLIIILINRVANINACTLVGRERAAGFDVMGIRYTSNVAILGDVNSAIGAEAQEQLQKEGIEESLGETHSHLASLIDKNVMESSFYKDTYSHPGGWIDISSQLQTQDDIDEYMHSNDASSTRTYTTRRSRAPRRSKRRDGSVLTEHLYAQL